MLTDDGAQVPVRDGRVRCRAFPFVVLTSNGERDFPAPLMRRCIHLELGRPDDERLAALVRAHFGDEAAERDDLITRSWTLARRTPRRRPAAERHLPHPARGREDAGRREASDELLMRPLDPAA